MTLSRLAHVFAVCLWTGAISAGTTGTADDKTATVRDPLVEAGEGMYRQGVLPSGEPMKATVQKDVPLAGIQAACMSCHRRSGLSAMEGQTLVPPVSGDLLYQPREIRRKELYQVRTEGPGTRPAYTDETLARAIREGTDPAGRVLDRLMPRYALTDDELKPLIAYLKDLSSMPSPGVSDSAIHFATIVTDGVDEDKREAMLAVLETYVHARNAETRHERRRAAHSPFHKEWKYKAYRDWVLHVWHLSGPNATWRDQLEQQYRKEPVFAVISGIGEGSWRPVHEFCNARQVPCLFPDTDLPAISADGFYSLYFSRGVMLDAEVLARYLRDQPEAVGKGPILQVFRDEQAGVVAAEAFRKALTDDRRITLIDKRIDVVERLTPEFWAELVRRHRPSLVVLWLRQADLMEIGTLAGIATGPDKIYLSFRLCTDPLSFIPRDLRSRVYLAYPYSLPNVLARKGRQTERWLQAQGSPVTDVRLQVNTLFTARLLGEALMHIRSNFYREYFIEKIEDIVDRFGASAAYPRLSLGPDQRFASTGSYIVGITPEADGDLAAVSEWIVP